MYVKNQLDTKVRVFTLETSPYGQCVQAALTNGGVVDVVIRCNHAQVQRCHVHLILNADALGLLQIVQSVLHQLRQMIRQVPV